MKFGIIITLYLFFWISCAPYVKYQVVEASKVAKSPEYNISIYHELDPLPPQSRVMGELRIDNAVPSMVNCGYLDIIKLVKDNFKIPVFAYQVSGEYSLIKNGIRNKILNKEAIYESLISFKRAGANAIVTYFAYEIASKLK